MLRHSAPTRPSQSAPTALSQGTGPCLGLTLLGFMAPSSTGPTRLHVLEPLKGTHASLLWTPASGHAQEAGAWAQPRGALESMSLGCHDVMVASDWGVGCDWLCPPHRRANGRSENSAASCCAVWLGPWLPALFSGLARRWRWPRPQVDVSGQAVTGQPFF